MHLNNVYVLLCHVLSKYNDSYAREFHVTIKVRPIVLVDRTLGVVWGMLLTVIRNFFPKGGYCVL